MPVNFAKFIGTTAGAAADLYLKDIPLYVNGFEFDSDTNLYRAGSRWYDATTGRFLETSGQGDGGGYAFVIRHNNTKHTAVIP